VYFLVGKGGRCVRLTTLPPSCAVVVKSANLNFLEPSGPLQACNGTDLPIYNESNSNDESLPKSPSRSNEYGAIWNCNVQGRSENLGKWLTQAYFVRYRYQMNVPGTDSSSLQWSAGETVLVFQYLFSWCNVLPETGSVADSRLWDTGAIIDTKACRKCKGILGISGLIFNNRVNEGNKR
jgi:hypothetical protein